MSPRSERRLGCVARALRAYVVFVVGVVGVSLALGYFAAGRRIRAAEEGWSSSFESMERFAARYPTRPNSAALEKLDVMARPLGAGMVFRPENPGGPKLNEAVLKAAGAFISEQSKAADDTMRPAPGEVRAFLERNAAAIDAIEKHLLTAGSLESLEEIGNPAAPIPSLLGHRYLQNLLLTRALEADRLGRSASVDRSLSASWKLNRSVAARADLISQLIVLAVSGMQHGVVRRVSPSSSAWIPRLSEEDFRTAALRSYQLEAYSLTRIGGRFRGIFDVNEMEGDQPRPNGPFVFLGRLLTTPYLRLSLAGHSDQVRRTAETLRSSDLCTVDVDRLADTFAEDLPRWNVIGRIAGPSVVRAWTSVAELSLDAELTRLVLESRDGAAAAEAAWPRPSTVCANFRWVRGVARDGGITVRPDAPPFPHSKFPRTWSFTSSPRGAVRRR